MVRSDLDKSLRKLPRSAWVTLAESGLLTLDAKSTQFTDSGIAVYGGLRACWRKFPSIRGPNP